MRISHAIAVAAAPFLAACETQEATLTSLTADLAYSTAAGLGFQNDGLLDPGTLFRWDTGSNRLLRLDVLPLEAGTPGAPADLTSSRVRGFGFRAGQAVTGAELQAASAALGQQATFRARSAARHSYRRRISAMSGYVAELLGEGQDPDLRLGTRDPEARVVLIDTVVRARERSLIIGGTDVDWPGEVGRLEVAGGALEIRVLGGSLSSCAAPEGGVGAEGAGGQESLPACFFAVKVYDPFYPPEVANPTLQWEEVPFDADRLSEAFRALSGG